jgi:carboxyl-terminal processing protease
LLTGDEIISADGTPFEPVRSFRDKVGKQVIMTLRRAGALQQLPVTPIEIEPNKMFLAACRIGALV